MKGSKTSFDDFRAKHTPCVPLTKFSMILKEGANFTIWKRLKFRFFSVNILQMMKDEAVNFVK